MANHLRQYVRSGWLHPASVIDNIFDVAAAHGLTGEPGSDKEATIMQIAMSVNLPAELRPTARSDSRSDDPDVSAVRSLETKTPAAWKGTEPLKQRAGW